VQAGIVSNCDSFYLVKTSDQCNTIASSTGITVAEFLSWNPSAGADCTGLWANTYACVSIIGHTPATPSPSTPWNGITTPSPVRDGMSSSCDSFYFVQSGDTCTTISSKSGISVTQFLGWNPTAGGTACAGLWANTYVCISIIGHTPTTTAPGNGVSTPSPIQDGMTKTCNKFHLVASGETCATIAPKYSITVAQFVSWNPAAKADCTGLWAQTYACVGLI
jgi:LysM repeat protein